MNVVGNDYTGGWMMNTGTEDTRTGASHHHDNQNYDDFGTNYRNVHIWQSVAPEPVSPENRHPHHDRNDVPYPGFKILYL